MTRYLLDANAISVMARDPRGVLARRVRLIGSDNLCTSIIVMGELHFGIARNWSARLVETMAPVMEMLTVEPLSSDADIRYAELRAHLQRQGRLIGANDLWIAAHALALDCTLVTANIGEFSRVPDLHTDNWLVG